MTPIDLSKFEIRIIYFNAASASDAIPNLLCDDGWTLTHIEGDGAGVLWLFLTRPKVREVE